MKKTINISLNGLIFIIEEDAYNNLDNYLNSIKDYYAALAERDEIISDIESSIADKFQEVLKGQNRALELKEIENVIKVMGTVDDFSKENEAETIINKNEASSAKRLYRDEDDKIIAGVCSGLANYFGIDVVWVRLIFIALLAFKGLGFILYIILWIVVPIAKSSTQKLEMKGKPINLKKIEQEVKEKSKIIKEKSEEALEAIKNNKVSLANIIRTPFNILSKILKTTSSIILKVLKVSALVLSVLVGIVLLISFIASILALTVAIGVAIFNINSPYLISDIPLDKFIHSYSYYLALASAYLIALIPLIFFSVLSISLIRRKNTFRVWPCVILTALWIIAIAGAAIASVDLYPKIKYEVDNYEKHNTSNRIFDYRYIEASK